MQLLHGRHAEELLDPLNVQHHALYMDPKQVLGWSVADGNQPSERGQEETKRCNERKSQRVKPFYSAPVANPREKGDIIKQWSGVFP